MGQYKILNLSGYKNFFIRISFISWILIVAINVDECFALIHDGWKLRLGVQEATVDFRGSVGIYDSGDFIGYLTNATKIGNYDLIIEETGEIDYRFPIIPVFKETIFFKGWNIYGQPFVDIATRNTKRLLDIRTITEDSIKSNPTNSGNGYTEATIDYGYIMGGYSIGIFFTFDDPKYRWAKIGMGPVVSVISYEFTHYNCGQYNLKDKKLICLDRTNNISHDDKVIKVGPTGNITIFEYISNDKSYSIRILDIEVGLINININFPSQYTPPAIGGISFTTFNADVLSYSWFF